MLDLVIQGGQVVTPVGVDSWDVGTQGEKIVALGAPGSLPEAGRVIDATGKIVMPGAVEAHAHLAAPISTQLGSGIEDSGPAACTRAALFGGTTFVMDFAAARAPKPIHEAVADRGERWAGQAFCDYSYHIILGGEVTSEQIAQMNDAVVDGFASFKLFTTSVHPTLQRLASPRVDFGRVHAIMEEAARVGAMVAVHSEDDDVVFYNYEKLRDRGTTEWWRMPEVHSRLSEKLSFQRTLGIAAATGAAMYFVHVSAKEGVDLIAEARSSGLPVYGETLHNYLVFDQENYKEPDGMKYHTYPSLKTQEDRDRLWHGMLRDDMSIMATDHISTPYKVKTMGRSVENVTGGHNGIETRVGVTYTEAVSKRGMSLERYVDVIATNPAKILGLYPRKGQIAPGSDADIVLLDPNFNRALKMDDLHLEDYSIWEGRQVTGWPVMTILRGKVAVENGELLTEQGSGQLIPRKVSSETLNRPAC